MIMCVIFGISLGMLINWQKHQLELLEVRVIRVVQSRDQSSMRFVETSLPHTIVEFRPPIKQWAVPGIAGNVGDVVFELPPVE